MRELKFQAFSEKSHQMIKGYPVIKNGIFDSFVEDITGSTWGAESWKLQLRQFTGLTDRNGKEIFENDLLSFEDGDGEVGEVIFECGSWILSFSEDITLFGMNPNSCCQVIGNRFENPELLEVSNA